MLFFRGATRGKSRSTKTNEKGIARKTGEFRSERKATALRQSRTATGTSSTSHLAGRPRGARRDPVCRDGGGRKRTRCRWQRASPTARSAPRRARGAASSHSRVGSRRRRPRRVGVAGGGRRRARCDVAVLGGGAAGLTAAYFAAKAGARVTVYERNKETGKKILMSGGARCNVLPVSARVEDFVTESTPRLMKNVLASWNVERCREWLEDDLGFELGIEHVTNKYFPLSNSSQGGAGTSSCARAKTRACARAMARSVEGLRATPATGTDGPFDSADAPEERVPVVVLAMGGLSFPAVGTDGTGYAIARRDLGHVLKEPYPALVPLTGEHPGGERLPGLSVDVSLVCAMPARRGGGQEEEEEESKGVA